MYLFLRLRSIARCFWDNLYIPQCIYFYLNRWSLYFVKSLALHSTMYLFLLSVALFYFTGGFTLHSTMYLFLPYRRSTQIALSQLYIPQCIYFYTRPVCFPSSFRVTLHSTMYLFLHFYEKVLLPLGQLYIPQCIYFYMMRFLISLILLLLYIPQCIYFYNPFKNTRQGFPYFTFHNVSISTGTFVPRSIWQIIFTFHNVSISTDYRSGRQEMWPVFTFHNVSISTARSP